MSVDIFAGVEDAAKQIGISPSTVKKYYLLLEQKGYRFNRTKQGHMLFSQEDIFMFRELIEVKNRPGMTLEKAIGEIITSITDTTVMTENENRDVTVITDDIKNIKEAIESQQRLINVQSQQISELIESNNESKRLLENSVSNRDDLLMKTLKETIEVKQLLQKKKWWEFWK